MGKKHIYTKEQIDFLKENIKVTPYVELTRLFNEKFNLNISQRAIEVKCSRLHLFNERPKGFRGYHWAKGLSKEEYKKHYSNQAYEKIINNLRKYSEQKSKKIGSIIKCGNKERIIVKETTGDGKPTTSRSVLKAKYIYEQAFGKTPKNSVVIHLNGNENDYNLNNLICVSRNELLQVNKYHCFGKGKITEAMVEIARTQQIINKKCKGE